MRLFSFLLLFPLTVAAQSSAPAEVQTKTAPNLPPRSSAADYQAQGQAGKATIGAELAGHSVPAPEATFNTEEYLVVEVGIFGPPGTKGGLSPDQFSLRINGKKNPIVSSPYELVFKSLKDPEWEAEAATKVAESKSKTSIGGTGGGGGSNDPPPAPPKIPIGRQRAMELKVQKASLPEGDRPLPQAGFVYFQYSGKTKSIKSIELLYSGPLGKATLALQP